MSRLGRALVENTGDRQVFFYFSNMDEPPVKAKDIELNVVASQDEALRPYFIRRQ